MMGTKKRKTQQIPKKQKRILLQKIVSASNYIELQRELKVHTTAKNSLLPNIFSSSDSVAAKIQNTINPEEWATIIFTSGSII